MNRLEKLEWLARNVHDCPDLASNSTADDLTVAWWSVAPGACYRGLTRQEWLSMREKLQNKPEPDNSWHERGELPPVGTECQFFSDGYDANWFDWCIFRGLATCGGFIIEHHHRTSPKMVTVTLFDPALTKFRPLRTEREKAIDAAREAIGGVGEDELLVIEKLYDAGMLKQ